MVSNLTEGIIKKWNHPTFEVIFKKKTNEYLNSLYVFFFYQKVELSTEEGKKLG